MIFPWLTTSGNTVHQQRTVVWTRECLYWVRHSGDTTGFACSAVSVRPENCDMAPLKRLMFHPGQEKSYMVCGIVGVQAGFFLVVVRSRFCIRQRQISVRSSSIRQKRKIRIGQIAGRIRKNQHIFHACFTICHEKWKIRQDNTWGSLPHCCKKGLHSVPESGRITPMQPEVESCSSPFVLVQCTGNMSELLMSAWSVPVLNSTVQRSQKAICSSTLGGPGCSRCRRLHL